METAIAKEASPAGSSRRTWLWVVLITLAALLIRGGMIELVGDATNFRVAEKNPRALTWEWGYEQAAVSESVALGRGFSDPFHRPSGPTAWAAPAYPLLVAALLRITDGPSWSTALTLGLILSLIHI